MDDDLFINVGTDKGWVKTYHGSFSADAVLQAAAARPDLGVQLALLGCQAVAVDIDRELHRSAPGRYLSPHWGEEYSSNTQRRIARRTLAVLKELGVESGVSPEGPYLPVPEDC